MSKATKKNVKYKEPDDYIPEDIWNKYFNPDGTPKKKTEDKAQDKKEEKKKKTR